MALNAYISQVQRLLHDPTAQFWSVADLTAYINEARGQIAAEGQCVRVLPPITGGVASITIVTGGTGYLTPPTVSLTGSSGSGFTGTAVLTGTAVTSVTVTAPGSNYPPNLPITFTSASGSGASAIAILANANLTVAQQEVYTFASVNPLVQLTAGVSSILSVNTLACSWGQGMKPVLFQYPWSDFQAQLRSYSIGLQGYSMYWAQFGQGGNGSIYLWPIPSGAYQMDWDCNCLPIALVSDADPEAIPPMWQDAIKFYAAHLATNQAQRAQDSDRYFGLYEKYMQRARAQAEPPFIPDLYGMD